MRQKKFILQEKDLPKQWYNIQAEMPNKPLPPLNPKTKEPLSAEDLAHIFNLECSKQELDTEHAWIDIPEESDKRGFLWLKEDYGVTVNHDINFQLYPDGTNEKKAVFFFERFRTYEYF